MRNVNLFVKSLTFVDEGVEVAPEDEQANEEEVEEDAEGEYDPGEDLPGPPGPGLVVGLLRGSLPGLLPVQNLNHAFFRSLQGQYRFPDSVQPALCAVGHNGHYKMTSSVEITSRLFFPLLPLLFSKSPLPDGRYVGYITQKARWQCMWLERRMKDLLKIFLLLAYSVSVYSFWFFLNVELCEIMIFIHVYPEENRQEKWHKSSFIANFWRLTVVYTPTPHTYTFKFLPQDPPFCSVNYQRCTGSNIQI